MLATHRSIAAIGDTGIPINYGLMGNALSSEYRVTNSGKETNGNLSVLNVQQV
jgi:hypothetical protein